MAEELTEEDLKFYREWEGPMDIESYTEWYLNEEDPQLGKAAKLHEDTSLSWEDWLREFEEYREEKTDKEYKDAVWLKFIISKPRNLRKFIHWKICTEFTELGGRSVRDIVKTTGLSKSRVQRLLEKEPTIKPTLKDVSWMSGVSVPTLRKWIKEYEEGRLTIPGF